MHKHLIAAILIMLPVAAQAQTKPDWQSYYEQLSTLDEAENATWEDAYDALCELEQHKIDLNTATREDLERLVFLTQQQVEELSEYLYKYAPMRSLGELSMIESLDEPRRKLLECFVYLDDRPQQRFPSLKNILNYGRNELMASARVPFYERRGDRNGYLGYRYKHGLRYTYSYGQNVKIGMVAAQDAGEPFFAGRNAWGYDYYSFYLMLRHWGRLKALAVGRYRLKIGMGLVMNNDYGFGKTVTLSTLGRSTNGIRAHTSRSEANYLQGAAATVALFRGFDLMAFASHRRIDTTPTTDSAAIATLLQTGYHRTPSEMNRKHNASQTLFGTHLRYTSGGFHAGITALHTAFSKPLRPNTRSLYRQYDPIGKQFWNASLNYGYTNGRLSFQGETATGNTHALATLNMLSYRLSSSLSVMALQRFYSYRYQSLFGESFREGARVQNESGMYVGAEWQASHRLKLSAYTDYAYFPWARYRVSKASRSSDNLLSAVWQKGNLTIAARYRLRFRQQDNEDKTQLVNTTEHRCRLSVALNGGTHWLFKTQIDGVCHHALAGSNGIMGTQTVGYTARRMVLNAAFGYFNTHDYNSRVYVYERGMRYNFSFPVFFGHGMRYMVMGRASLSSQLSLLCKVGTTHYFDRDHISSSYQQIDRRSQTDADVQLVWKF